MKYIKDGYDLYSINKFNYFSFIVKRTGIALDIELVNPEDQNDEIGQYNLEYIQELIGDKKDLSYIKTKEQEKTFLTTISERLYNRFIFFIKSKEIIFDIEAEIVNIVLNKSKLNFI